MFCFGPFFGIIQNEEIKHRQELKMVLADSLNGPSSKKRRYDNLVDKLAKRIDSYNGGYVLYLLHVAKLVMNIH